MLDHQNKFDTTLTRMKTDLPDLRQNLSDLKQNYTKLESELRVDWQVNNKLKDHIVSLESQCWSNSQYSRQECLELVVSMMKLTKKIRRIQHWIFLENSCWNWFLKCWGLSLVTEQGAQTCNHQIVNEKMQTEFAIARKTWRRRFDFTLHFFSRIH